jgi:hypothetical protein
MLRNAASTARSLFSIHKINKPLLHSRPRNSCRWCAAQEPAENSFYSLIQKTDSIIRDLSTQSRNVRFFAR